MPPKRKLTLKLNSNKKQNIKSHSNSSLLSFYSSIITQLNNLKDPKTNELIIGPFLKLPSKKIFPDYYKIIKNPISINEIKSKFLAKKKSNGNNNVTINEFLKSFKLLKDNALTYNDSESLIAKDATTVYNFVESNVEEFNKSNNDLVDEETVKEDENAEEEEDDEDEENEDDENEDDVNEDAIEDNNNNNEIEKRLNIPDEFINNPNDNDNIDMDCDDINEDYTVELFKVLRHLLNFKVSHHKNSQPLSVPFLNLVDKTIYPNYYKLIKNPMSFNIIKVKLENNNYNHGSIGYRKFVRDINLIFDNARVFNEEGSIIYKNATSLGKAFIKRIEKFNIQIVEKRRNLILNAKLEKEIEEKELEKNKLDKELEKKKERDNEKQLEIENQLNNKIKNNNNNNINNNIGIENLENESELDNLNDKINYNNQLKPEVPNFVRKHDIEKAVKIEEIDDITAFIKKFVLKSNYNLVSSDNYFENIIIEPAGNSTIGGSTYSAQLSSNLIIGKEISCLIYLQNKIIDEKYITEFKVNNEIIKSQPMTIDYDELQGENGEFLACKFEFKIGYGLNQFEFNLKVPFPLKDMELLSKRSTTNQEFIETVKLWVVVTN